MIASRRCAVAVGVLACAYLGGQPLFAQAEHFSSELLPTLRRAAALPPGDPPTSVRFVLLNPFRAALQGLVEGAPIDTVRAAYPVFQIRFPRGWIAVDAALDRSFVPRSTTFSDEVYGHLHEALRDARLIVVTHEHHDHVAGVLRSPHLAQVQEHTLLTSAQVRSLQIRPNHELIRIDSAIAARYLVVDFDPILPIAPGVVLIKAPGHTPGSLFVYVRLNSGVEILLAGDAAWNMAGVRIQAHKPEAPTRSFGGEDRQSVAAQLRWLNDAEAAGVSVVVSHDVAWIDELVAQGVLVRGFDVTSR